MTQVLFDSARPVKSAESFGRGIESTDRVEHPDESPDWDAMALEAERQDRLSQGFVGFDPIR
jgi:hypothetical protein